MRYSGFQVCTTEIPDEISLGISCLGCNVHCTGCHSQETWDIYSIGKGKQLKVQDICDALDKQKYITCVLFFGGEWAVDFLKIVKELKDKKPDIKIALYTGRILEDFKNKEIINYLDYIKVGPYNKVKGNLRSKTTNQKLYKLENGRIAKNITHMFWRNNE